MNNKISILCKLFDHAWIYKREYESLKSFKEKPTEYKLRRQCERCSKKEVMDIL